MDDFDWMDDFEIKEFEGSETYHRSYDIPPEITPDELSEFIRSHGQENDDGYLVRYTWIDENGVEQTRSTWSHMLDDFEDWYPDFADDADQYEAGSPSGFQVVYMGAL
jgi:hypothetical protein